MITPTDLQQSLETAARQVPAATTSPDAGTPTAATTAGAPPAPAPAAAPTAQGAAANPSPASAPAPTAPAGDPHHENIGMHIMKGILGALGGTEETSYRRASDDDVKNGLAKSAGELITTTQPKTPGQQWKTIIAGALSGVAAAAQVKPGPGVKGRAAGAGLAAGMKMAQDQDAGKVDTANEDFDAQLKATREKAAVAKMNQDIAEGAWKMTREKADFQMKNTQMATEFHNLVMGDPSSGNEDFGAYSSFKEFLDKHKENGAQIGQMNANKELRAMPIFDNDGKLAGVQIFKINKAWEDQVNAQPVQIDFGPKIDKDGKAESDIQTIPAGGMKNSKIMDAKQAGATNWLSYISKTAGAKKDVAQAGEANAKATEATEVTPKLRFQEQQQNYRATTLANSKKDDKEKARADKSYTYNHGELVKMQQPLDGLIQRMGRLNETLAQATPQADALVAPELLTVMAGGQGSGLRMNEAEIARIVGGRSKWESLKASVNKWRLDPKKANSITPEQRSQIHSLVDAVNNKLLAKQQIVTDAHQSLIDTDDVDTHRQVVANVRKQLNAIDNGSAVILKPPQQQRQGATPAASATPPAGATDEVFGQDGKTLIGHVVNGTYVPLTAGGK